MSGWIFECIYRGVIFSFFKEKYFSVFKLRKWSEKSVSMRLVSILIASLPLLNKLIMSFNLPTLGPLPFCSMASPSSLYKHTLLDPRRALTLFEMYNQTSSYTSALLKLPIETSNNGFLSFFYQNLLSSNNRDFFAWFTMLIISPII